MPTSASPRPFLALGAALLLPLGACTVHNHYHHGSPGPRGTGCCNHGGPMQPNGPQMPQGPRQDGPRQDGNGGPQQPAHDDPRAEMREMDKVHLEIFERLDRLTERVDALERRLDDRSHNAPRRTDR